MKRDPDLVRNILLALENKASPNDTVTAKKMMIDGRSEEEINYHLLLLLEAGYIRGKDSSSDNRTIVFVTRLTWKVMNFWMQLAMMGVGRKLNQLSLRWVDGHSKSLSLS